MKFKKICLFFAAALFSLVILSSAAVAFAKGSSSQSFPYPDVSCDGSSPSVEMQAFSASMGPSSQKWKNVDKTSLPALENFRAEYFAAKGKLSDRAATSLNDGSFTAELNALIAERRKTFPKSFRVLSIGNSFSKDAVKFLYQVAKNAGAKNIVVASMHISACDLKTHRANAEGDLPVYKYSKNKSGKIKVYSDVSLLSALRDENWDYVTLQQSSPLSGVEKSYNHDLDFMVKYILKNRPCPTTKLCWHMTWAFSKKYDNESFSVYNFDQSFMYDSICRAVRNKIVPDSSFTVLIPVGTAVQNLRTSYIGDRLNRDGRHLNALGQYTAAMTFVRSLGYSIDGVKWVPKSKKVSRTYLPAIKAAVNDSLSVPLSVTDESRVCNHKEAKDGALNTVVTKPGRPATCESSGLTDGAYCKVCRKVLKKQLVIPKLTQHKYVFKVKTPATMKTNGEKIGTCKVCGHTEKRLIHKIKSVSLSKTSFTCSKKVVTPTVTVKDSAGNTLRESIDYTLAFSGGRREIGKYSVRVVFKNKYKGKADLEFSIVPHKTSIKSAKPLLKGIALSWKEQEDITGFIIEYGTDPAFSGKSIKRLKIGASETAKLLAAQEKGLYFVRIRTYKNVTTGKKTTAFCSEWSSAEKVTVK